MEFYLTPRQSEDKGLEWWGHEIAQALLGKKENIYWPQHEDKIGPTSCIQLYAKEPSINRDQIELPSFVKNSDHVSSHCRTPQDFFKYYFARKFTHNVLELLQEGDIEPQKLADFDEKYNEIWQPDERTITIYSNILKDIDKVDTIKEYAPNLAKSILEYAEKYDGIKLFIPSEAQDFVSKYPDEALFLAKKIIKNDANDFYENEKVNPKDILELYHTQLYKLAITTLRPEKTETKRGWKDIFKHFNQLSVMTINQHIK